MVNGEVVNGTVAAIDDDGHYSLTCDCDKTVTAVQRSELCLEWQMDRSCLGRGTLTRYTTFTKGAPALACRTTGHLR